MAILSITYDLRKPGRNYDELYQAIKKLGSWAHPAQSVWLVDTTKSTSDVRDELKKHVDSNDRILVVGPDVPRWAAFNLDDKVINWMKTHF